jgi:hypothetical protein
VRSASLVLLALFGWACSQPLPPVTNPFPTSTPVDFFWSARSLDSAELTYAIDRNGATNNHAIFSHDDVHVFDQSIGAMAFRIVSRGDTIAIDSLGSNSLFSLPQGYFFAKDTTIILSRTVIFRKDSIANINGHDTTVPYDSVARILSDSVVQRPGTLTLLERAFMTNGGFWFAGKIAGIGLGKGLEITGRVLDHVDTLLIPALQNVPATSYGETFMVKYSHEQMTDTLHFPIFWKVYYARNVGPVLIEEYLDSTSSYSPKLSLQSQAILRSK